jgi:hypothetical protein
MHDVPIFIKLDNAIKGLAAQDESLARLIEMRYFGGMTAEASFTHGSVEAAVCNFRFYCFGFEANPLGAVSPLAGGETGSVAWRKGLNGE